MELKLVINMEGKKGDDLKMVLKMEEFQEFKVSATSDRRNILLPK